MIENTKISITAMNRLMYFMANWQPNFIKKCWADDPNLADHFEKKFNYYYDYYKAEGCFLIFYLNLSGGNQVKLLNWILENYTDEQKLNIL